MQASPTWPLVAIRRQVSRTIDVVIHLHRLPDGSRRIAEAVEVLESDGEPDGQPLIAGGTVVGSLGRGRR
jgi:pilus assembly protein CpaF